MNTNQIREKARAQAKYPYVKPDLIFTFALFAEFGVLSWN